MERLEVSTTAACGVSAGETKDVTGVSTGDGVITGLVTGSTVGVSETTVCCVSVGETGMGAIGVQRITMRRFLARPSSVELSSIGSSAPWPLVDKMVSGGTFLLKRYFFVFSALARDNLSFSHCGPRLSV